MSRRYRPSRFWYFLLLQFFSFFLLDNAFYRPPLPDEYDSIPTCVEYIDTCELELSSSVSAFKNLISLLSSSATYSSHLDRDATSRLKEVNPMAPGMNATPDFWDFVFNRCKVTKDDILITIIYKLGLVRTARTLYGKRFIDRVRYLLAKSKDGKNIMHHAVLSRNPELVQHVAFLLREDVISLTEAKDINNETPIDLTSKRGFDGVGVVEMLSKIYATFKDGQIPSTELAVVPNKIEQSENKEQSDQAVVASGPKNLEHYSGVPIRKVAGIVRDKKQVTQHSYYGTSTPLAISGVNRSPYRKVGH